MRYTVVVFAKDDEGNKLKFPLSRATTGTDLQDALISAAAVPLPLVAGMTLTGIKIHERMEGKRNGNAGVDPGH
jgi:hypothetical protein